MPFEIPNFERKICHSCASTAIGAILLKSKQKIFFFFQSQGPQMAFSDFVMKKQNQSRQIQKRLNWVAGGSKIIKLFPPCTSSQSRECTVACQIVLAIHLFSKSWKIQGVPSSAVPQQLIGLLTNLTCSGHKDLPFRCHVLFYYVSKKTTFCKQTHCSPLDGFF